VRDAVCGSAGCAKCIAWEAVLGALSAVCGRCWARGVECAGCAGCGVWAVLGVVSGECGVSGVRGAGRVQVGFAGNRGVDPVGWFPGLKRFRLAGGADLPGGVRALRACVLPLDLSKTTTLVKQVRRACARGSFAWADLLDERGWAAPRSTGRTHTAPEPYVRLRRTSPCLGLRSSVSGGRDPYGSRSGLVSAGGPR
jgi:hypothetical protein